MHPLEKIFVMMAVCQVLHATYTMRRLHGAHSGMRYWLEMAPLIVALAVLVILVLRFLHLIGYVGV
jgi:hypothetical protein